MKLVMKMFEAVIHLLVGENNMISVEQPISFEYGKDKMVVVDYLGFFVLPDKYYETTDVWVHELIEKTVTEEVMELDESGQYAICFQDYCVSIFHIVTSLSTGSGWDEEELSPEQFWEKLQELKSSN